MKNNIKIIFLGNPAFALPSLEALINPVRNKTSQASADAPSARRISNGVKENYQIVGVITSPDKPAGRKQILTPPAIKVFAEKNNLPVYQPKDKSELFEIVKNLQPDLAIVVAYGMLLPKEVLEIPKYGFINIHPSLLPKYRGATPIQSAILNGDEKTGVSLFLIDEKKDTGAIIANSEFRMQNAEWNYETLSKKLANLGADLLIEALPKYINGEITPLPQDDSQATYTKKIKTEDAFVDLGKDSPAEIERKVRALNPEPGTWTIRDEKRMKILEAELTTDGKLKLKKIQYEGKKPINV